MRGVKGKFHVDPRGTEHVSKVAAIRAAWDAGCADRVAVAEWSGLSVNDVRYLWGDALYRGHAGPANYVVSVRYDRRPALDNAAKERGISTAELIKRIIATVCDDADLLVNAILDDK